MLPHLQDLSPVTLLMMGIGTIVAFWVGQDAGFRAPAVEPSGRDRPMRTARGAGEEVCGPVGFSSPDCDYNSRGAIDPVESAPA